MHSGQQSECSGVFSQGVRIFKRKSILGWVVALAIRIVRLPGRFRNGRAVASFLLFLCAAVPLHAEPLAVSVVQSEEGGAYQEFTAVLREQLAGYGITFTVRGMDAPTPETGLVVSVGTKAATAVAAGRAPFILNVLIPKAGYDRLLRDFPARAGTNAFSAIYLDQPTERQVRLIAAALPDRRRVGLLYSSPSEELGQLRRRMADYGMTLEVRQVGELPLPEALQALLDDSEVLLALPDSAVYNGSTIRNILLSTYRSGVPLIGLSPAYVRAGALCAVSSSPAQIAAQAAAAIRQFAETRALPAAQYPQEFEVTVNEQVARSLGLRIKPAAELRQEIRAAERSAP